MIMKENSITLKILMPCCLALTLIFAWRGFSPQENTTIKHSYIQNTQTTIENPNTANKPFDFDDFFKKELHATKKETNFQPQNQKLNNLVNKVIDDPIFKYFNISFLKKNNSLNDSFFQKYYNEEQLFKMQKLTKYISKKYSISIPQAEEIIYNTFLQSHEQNLNPLLLLSVISVESTFQPNVQSPSGAIGLTQVIPKYHQNKIQKLDNPTKDLWSIDGNIQVGAEILKEYLVLSKHNLRNALHRYNGSYNDPSNKYSKKVLSKLNQYQIVYNDS